MVWSAKNSLPVVVILVLFRSFGSARLIMSPTSMAASKGLVLQGWDQERRSI